MFTVKKARESTSTLERTRAALDGLTKAQIVELVTERIVPEDAASFAVLSEGLSLDALKFLSARALVRARINRESSSDEHDAPLSARVR